MNLIFDLFVATVATERITEIIVSSNIFEPLRQFISKLAFSSDAPPKNTLLQKFKVSLAYFITCGYCVSVWVATVVVLYMELSFGHPLVIIPFVHGMSNLYHVIYELIRRGRVKTYDLTVNAQHTQHILSQSDRRKRWK